MSQSILSVRDSDGNWIPIPAIQGAPGVSPTVAVSDIAGGHRVTIADATGPHSYDVIAATEPDSGWINPHSGRSTYYRSIGSRITVRFETGSGAYFSDGSESLVFTLPEGYRPVNDRYFVCFSEYNNVKLPVIVHVSASSGMVKVQKAPWAEMEANSMHQVQCCEISFLAN